MLVGLKVGHMCVSVSDCMDATIVGPTPVSVHQAASPDEAALVVAAKVFGFFFRHRTPNSVVVRESGETGDEPRDQEYEILAVLEFDSTRKRQSVVVREPDGSIILYCKVSCQASLGGQFF